MWAPTTLIKAGSMQHNLGKQPAEKMKNSTKNTYLKGQSTTFFPYHRHAVLSIIHPSKTLLVYGYCLTADPIIL